MLKLTCLFAFSLFLMPCRLTAQWSTAELSEQKFYTQTVAAGGKAFFVGGAKPGFVPSNQVEIYDFSKQQWTTRTMQKGRVLPGLVAVDSLVFIAGGLNTQTNAYYKEVEIYDVKNDQWRPVQNLSVARASIAAVKLGDELWFAGGYVQNSATTFTFYDVIDVFNLQTGAWTTRKLSVPRQCTGIVLNNKVVFAGGQTQGGATDVVDIFDLATQQWSQAKLSLARFNTTMATAGPKVFVAGGSSLTVDAMDVVDVWDTQTNTWTTARLSIPRALIGGASACNGNLAIFAGGGEADWDTRFLTTSSNQVDMYNATTGQWTQAQLSNARTAAFAASDGQHFFLGGGWKPEMQAFLNTAEFFNCTPSGTLERHDELRFTLSPNPSQEEFCLEFGPSLPETIIVSDMYGRQVAAISPSTEKVKVSLPQVPIGQYIISAIAKSGKVRCAVWVKIP